MRRQAGKADNYIYTLLNQCNDLDLLLLAEDQMSNCQVCWTRGKEAASRPACSCLLCIMASFFVSVCHCYFSRAKCA